MKAIRNLIAKIFYVLAEMLYVQPPTTRRAIRTLQRAKNFKATDNFDDFLKQLKQVPVKGVNALPAMYALHKEFTRPLRYEYCVELNNSTQKTTSMHRMLIYSSGVWKPITNSSRFDGALEGIVDELIQTLAANGWNCTSPVSDICESFVGMCLSTQHQNRSKELSGIDCVKLQLNLPFEDNPPRLNIRVYDEFSKVIENHAPMVIIPFFKASLKPSALKNKQKKHK